MKSPSSKKAARDASLDADYVAIVEYVADQLKRASGEVTRFPDELCGRLASRSSLPSELEPVLRMLLRIAAPTTPSRAELPAVLTRSALAVRALARATPATIDGANHVIALLESVQRTSYPHAPSKVDPQQLAEIELAGLEDALALACVEALARVGDAAPDPAARVLKNAERHRHADVRTAASAVLRIVVSDFGARLP